VSESRARTWYSSCTNYGVCIQSLSILVHFGYVETVFAYNLRKNVFTFSCELDDFWHFSFFFLHIDVPYNTIAGYLLADKWFAARIFSLRYLAARPLAGSPLAFSPSWRLFSDCVGRDMVFLKKKWKMSEIVQFAKIRKNIFYVNYRQKRFQHSRNGLK